MLGGDSFAPPQLRGLIAEVTEVKRKRVKMAADAEDDAYVLRFSRAILDPAAQQMVEAAPGIKSERAAALPGEFATSVSALDAACRAKSAADELTALVSADAALNELLELARKQKFDVAPRDDINSYEGATGVVRARTSNARSRRLSRMRRSHLTPHSGPPTASRLTALQPIHLPQRLSTAAR